MKKTLCSILALCTLAACTSDPSPPAASTGLGTHRGAVIETPPATAWAAAKATVRGMGSIEVDEATRTLRVVRSGEVLTIRIDPYDSAGTRSILRVAASAGGEPDPESADRVQLAIQRALLRK